MATNLTRRNFLKAASLAAASVPLSKVAARAQSGVVKAPLVAPGSFKNTQTAVGGVCEMCFWRCQLVGKVRDGRLVKLEGNPKSIDNGVSLCARGNAGVAYLYDPDRLKYPLKNVGKRAVSRFLLFNIRFRRGRTLLAGGCSGGHTGDRDGERWRTKQANQQQQDPRHGVLR